MTRKTKNTISTILRYVVLCAVGVLMFYPMLWMVGASLKADNNEIYSTISFIPKNPSFAAYVTDLGWVDTYKPLIVPSFFANEPYFVFMLVQFMRSVSKEMEEAAEIDGCNSLQRLIYIVVPIVKPSIVSVALFQFMWSSNDFQGPLIYINTVTKYPASLGLRLIADSETGFEWNKILALSVISIIPTLIVFFMAQDQFIDGIAAGGVKG